MREINCRGDRPVAPTEGRVFYIQIVRVVSLRLACPEQARDFVMEVMEGVK